VQKQAITLNPAEHKRDAGGKIRKDVDVIKVVIGVVLGAPRYHVHRLIVGDLKRRFVSVIAVVLGAVLGVPAIRARL